MQWRGGIGIVVMAITVLPLLIVGGMLFLIFKSSNSFKFNQREVLLKRKNKLFDFDKAWITSFISFIFLHMFDITYFDGRISLVAWILLAGMRQIIKESKEKKRNIAVF